MIYTKYTTPDGFEFSKYKDRDAFFFLGTDIYRLSASGWTGQPKYLRIWRPAEDKFIRYFPSWVPLSTAESKWASDFNQVHHLLIDPSVGSRLTTSFSPREEFNNFCHKFLKNYKNRNLNA